MLAVVVATPLYQYKELTAPQRLFDAAVQFESLGNIAAAHKKYQQDFQEYSQTELAVQALFKSAKIWQYDLQQDQKALLNYLQIEVDYPDHPLVQTAQQAAAHIIIYSLRDYPRAISFYQRLIDQPVVNRDKFLYEIADCYFRMDNYSQARIELETLQQEAPQSTLLPEVLYRKGGLLLLENRIDEAREDWQRLIDQFPENSFSVQARFNLAKLLEEEGRMQDALKLYQQLDNYPYPALIEEKIERLKKRIAEKKNAI